MWRIAMPGFGHCEHACSTCFNLEFGWDSHRALSLPRLSSVPHMMGFYDSEFLPEQANLVPHPFP